MDRIKRHNEEIRYKAEYRAQEMKVYPSKLEERMQLLLNGWHVFYEPQKIFYIKEEDGWIARYYIADFYIPSKRIIIEVDGKFHDKHTQHDKMRTRTIQEHYPGVEVLRYKWKDLSDKDKMEELMELLK